MADDDEAGGSVPTSAGGDVTEPYLFEVAWEAANKGAKAAAPSDAR